MKESKRMMAMGLWRFDGEALKLTNRLLYDTKREREREN